MLKVNQIKNNELDVGLGLVSHRGLSKRHRLIVIHASSSLIDNQKQTLLTPFLD